MLVDQGILAQGDAMDAAHPAFVNSVFVSLSLGVCGYIQVPLVRK